MEPFVSHLSKNATIFHHSDANGVSFKGEIDHFVDELPSRNSNVSISSIYEDDMHEAVPSQNTTPPVGSNV
jgi:hypothetical protein